MVKRLFEVLVAAAALVVLSPILIVAAVGIRLNSRGPVLYRARRIGLDGEPFTMFKFRTMHTASNGFSSAITAAGDPRVFRFGALLRHSKIDELPQLLNIVRGDMAIIGPRPEDPGIVANHYVPWQRETLRVRPGLASPGSIYNYTHAERTIPGSDPEAHYLAEVLPLKLALDLVYVRQASLWYDVRIVLRALVIILSIVAGKRTFDNPPEMAEARALLARFHAAASTMHQPSPDVESSGDGIAQRAGVTSGA